MAAKSTEGKGGGVLWCVSVALNVLWRHSFAGDGVGPKKLSKPRTSDPFRLLAFELGPSLFDEGSHCFREIVGQKEGRVPHGYVVEAFCDSLTLAGP
jgi:hypothetical protein